LSLDPNQAGARTCFRRHLFATQLIRETENGEKLALEVADSGVQSVISILPPAQFVSVRRGAPVRTYQQGIDE
jgi:hypothetical protein